MDLKALNKSWIKVSLVAILFLAVNLRLSIVDFYAKSYKFVFKSDGLCYYQYLPAWFIRHDLDKGMGYAIYLPDGKHFNKYTWGTAYLQAPFFFAAHGWSLLTGQPATGFTPVYGFFIALGAMIYAFLALLLTYRILCRYVSRLVSAFTVALLYMETNLLFYTLNEPAMSHVYSFFLIALFVYKVPGFVEKPNLPNTLWISFPLAIAVLTRPTNLIIGLYLLLYNVHSFKALAERSGWLLARWRMLAVMLAVAFLVFLPQMIYWHNITGHWFVYSYKFSVGGNESFIYWNNPKIFKVLFGVVSGWFVYSPVMLLFLAGITWMIIRKQINSIAILAVFLIILYVNASWWCYTFDCAFGYRSFIEYYSLFAIPVAFILQQLLPSGAWIRQSVFILLAVFFSYLNIRMSLIYDWDPCWIGENWTWKNYQKVLHYSLKGGSAKVNVHKLDWKP